VDVGADLVDHLRSAQDPRGPIAGLRRHPGAIPFKRSKMHVRMRGRDLAGTGKSAIQRAIGHDRLDRIDRLMDDGMQPARGLVAVGLRDAREAFLVTRRQHPPVAAARAPADVLGLDHDRVDTGLGEMVCRGQSSKARADNNNIRLLLAGHRRRNRSQIAGFDPVRVWMLRARHGVLLKPE